MKKIIRLTESDLMNLVKRVIKEQGQTFPMDGKPHPFGTGMPKNTNTKKTDDYFDLMVNKYGEFCGTKDWNKIYPYDENVKKYQIETNSQHGKKVVKEDGILGPDTKSWICYKGF
jgi:hypothetical protein